MLACVRARVCVCGGHGSPLGISLSCSTPTLFLDSSFPEPRTDPLCQAVLPVSPGDPAVSRTGVTGLSIMPSCLSRWAGS